MSIIKITDKYTAVSNRRKHDNEEFIDRQEQLEKTAPDSDVRGSDASLPVNQQHSYTADPLAKKKNFDQKLYFFPPEFSALREELEQHYPVFFTRVNPETGMAPANAMVFDAPQFIGLMNGALDLDMQLDTENVAGICKIFLNKLRIMRGVSPL